MIKLLTIILLSQIYLFAHADLAVYPRERTILDIIPLLIVSVILFIFVILPILFLLKKIRKNANKFK
jgi:hypothetical protein